MQTYSNRTLETENAQYACFHIRNVYVNGYDIENLIDNEFIITIPYTPEMVITNVELNDCAFQALSNALNDVCKDVYDFEWELINIK